MVVQNYLTYLEQDHSGNNFYIKALLVSKGENLDFDILCMQEVIWISVKIQAVGGDPEAWA